MQTQTILVVLIVAVAVLYLVRRWVRALRHKESCCSDCAGCSECGLANFKDQGHGHDSPPPPGCPGCE